MKNGFYQDTIVALSTPAGSGALGVIRLSGNKALQIAQAVWKGKSIEHQKSHTLQVGFIVDEQQIIDEAVVAVFKSPKSFTCENVVEFSCHGSPYILQKVLQLLYLKGARQASPGEFTLRAFLNGRFDLAQAEAVADLIAADSSSAHQLALQQMRGNYSHEILALREQLIHFAALVELELDFGEEDVEFVNKKELYLLVQEIIDHVSHLAQSFQTGDVLKNGVQTVIVGRPNAGKSTLLNVLLEEERAIVSDIPGTTRDIIEESLIIDTIKFRLIDTAGIRAAQDEIEKIGIEKTLKKAGQAALIIYLFDVIHTTEQQVAEDLEKLALPDTPIVLVGNKIDLINEDQLKTRFTHLKNTLWISSSKKMNLQDLKSRLLFEVIEKKIDSDVPIVSNARHYEALLSSKDALIEVKEGLKSGLSGDLLAQNIRIAQQALGSIAGVIDIDKDVLGAVFSKFCIGK